MDEDAAIDGEYLADEVLLARARTDTDAFAEFYRRHVEMVIGYFYRRTNSAQTAADLTAETFAAALASLSRFHPGRGAATAWLVGIARNQLRYYLRRRRVDRRARERLRIRTDIPLGPDQIERIHQRFDAHLLTDGLQEAWAELSPRIAEAVRMRVVDELPYAAIASALRCSEGAARTRVARGLSQLADAMGAK